MSVAKMNALPAKNWTLIVAGLLLAAGPVGCATPEARSDAALSPLSPRVVALVDANRTYPDWRSFPRSGPTPPSVGDVAAEVADLNAAARTAMAEVAAITWTLDDPQGFARQVRESVADVPVSAFSRQTREEIEAFARGLRDRGRAPPPIPRR